MPPILPEQGVFFAFACMTGASINIEIKNADQVLINKILNK
jgi:hypothetical protein